MKLTPWILTALLLVIGGVLPFFGIVEYSISFFFIFPFAAGFSIGLFTQGKTGKTKWYVIVLGLLIAFGFLIAMGFEGLICAALALPVILIVMLTGVWSARLYQKYVAREVNQPGAMKSILLPLIILIVADKIESYMSSADDLNVAVTAITLPYAKELVFDEVKAMDKLDGEKSWLLQLGLPTPYKCELEGDNIGAKRTCLYEDGKIVTEVTAFERGKILEMKVNEYTLAGARWFKFIDASYSFTEKNGETVLTRVTRFKSKLKPRFYWQPLEAWTIEAEHKFVLASLQKNMTEKFGSNQ
jgi:hypothetical protein